MKRAQSTLLILLMLSLSVSAQTAQSSSKTYQHTRRLLSHMKNYDSSLYSIDDPEFEVLLKRIPSYGKKPEPKESRGDNRLHLRSPMTALFRMGDERIED